MPCSQNPTSFSCSGTPSHAGTFPGCCLSKIHPTSSTPLFLLHKQGSSDIFIYLFSCPYKSSTLYLFNINISDPSPYSLLHPAFTGCPIKGGNSRSNILPIWRQMPMKNKFLKYWAAQSFQHSCHCWNGGERSLVSSLDLSDWPLKCRCCQCIWPHRRRPVLGVKTTPCLKRAVETLLPALVLCFLSDKWEEQSWLFFLLESTMRMNKI